MKKLISWVGGLGVVGVPAWSFFSSYAPPLFPGVTLIVAALSGAIWAAVKLPKRSGATQIAKERVKAALILIAAATVLIIAYILLLQFTGLPIPPEKEKRVQIGFGTANWSLTDVGRKWKSEHPAWTAEEIAEREAAFDQGRVFIVWNTWSVYCAGLGLIILYFVAFALWGSGFAILGIGGPQDQEKEESQPQEPEDRDV